GELLEGPADHPRQDDAQQRYLGNLLHDRRRRQLRRVAQELRVQLGDLDAVTVERVEAVGEERGRMDPLAEVRTKDEDGRALTPGDEAFRLFPAGDHLDADAGRLRQVALHDLGPRIGREALHRLVALLRWD